MTQRYRPGYRNGSDAVIEFSPIRVDVDPGSVEPLTEGVGPGPDRCAGGVYLNLFNAKKGASSHGQAA